MFTVSKTALNIDVTAVFLFICLHTHHKGMSHHKKTYIAQTECVTAATNTTNKNGRSDHFQHDYDEIIANNFIAIFFSESSISIVLFLRIDVKGNSSPVQATESTLQSGKTKEIRSIYPTHTVSSIIYIIHWP
jgi:hypothetical protein